MTPLRRTQRLPNGAQMVRRRTQTAPKATEMVPGWTQMTTNLEQRVYNLVQTRARNGLVDCPVDQPVSRDRRRDQYSGSLGTNSVGTGLICHTENVTCW